MKLIAGLSWYDESPAHLGRLVTSLQKLPVDHLVAVDGAYIHYPQGHASSDPLQYQVLVETAYALGIGLTIHRQSTPWYGNEVEKRNFLLRQCLRAADGPGDWMVIIDGDELVTKAAGVREQLEDTDRDVACVRFWNRRPEDGGELARSFWFPSVEGFNTHRVLFRCLPGLQLRTNHYTYMVRDRIMRGDDDAACEPALDLSQHLEIEHRHDYRSTERNGLAARYYSTREDLGLEAE